jgi:hypothetical protein
MNGTWATCSHDVWRKPGSAETRKQAILLGVPLTKALDLGVNPISPIFSDTHIT